MSAIILMMNAVDIVIVIVASSAIAVGMHVGLWRQIGLSAGLVAGCFVAALAQIFLGPAVVNAVGTDKGGLGFWLVLLACLLFVCLFTDFGWTLGQWVHKRWRRLFAQPLEQWLSRSAGALLAGVVAIAGLWLLSVIFLRSPNQVVANGVGHSLILRSLTQKLPAAPALFTRASNLVNPHALPVAFFDHEPAIGAQVPNAKASASQQKFTAKLQQAAVQISGRGCGGTVSGSGFVVADNLVLTDAHVIAGLTASNLSIFDSKGQHQAVPVYFDPRLDVAVLRSAGLAGDPMPLETAPTRQIGAGEVLGYSSGSLLASPVTITGGQSAVGYDIYNHDVVVRTIYAFRGRVEKGDSGAPLVDANGKVAGVVFAKSTDRPGIGYVLAASEFTAGLVSSLSGHEAIGTGQCGAE